MEKSTITRKLKFQSGLLKTIFLSFIYLVFWGNCEPIFSNDLNYSSLKITPESQWFFTQTDSSYILKIPQVSPSDVQITMPTMPDFVRFISSYKEEYLSDGNRGTSIRFWFNFFEPGEIKLKNITLKIKRKSYSLPFETVTVYDNPIYLVPQLHLEIKDSNGITFVPDEQGFISVSNGQKLFLDLFVRYTSRIFQFQWELPENALFMEIQRYPIVENHTESTVFSPELKPVANFEWTPLESGIYDLPKINISAVAYNGQRYELTMPSLKINYSLQKTQKTETRIHPALAEAFLEPTEEQETPKFQDSPSVTIEKASKLANLRIKEAYSLPFSKQKQQRIAYETELNLGKTPNEISVPLTTIGFAVGLVLIIISCIYLFFAKKKKIAISLFILAMTIISTTIIYAFPLTKTLGIFIGGEIRIVPEYNAEGNYSITELSRIQILEQTGEWYYIDLDGSGGWVPKSSVIKITKLKD